MLGVPIENIFAIIYQRQTRFELEIWHATYVRWLWAKASGVEGARKWSMERKMEVGGVGSSIWEGNGRWRSIVVKRK